MADNGPYETGRQARAAFIAAAFLAAGPAEPGQTVPMAYRNRDLLRRALDDAGVTTGAYDDLVLGWLAGYAPGFCQAIASWVTRAATHQKTQGEE